MDERASGLRAAVSEAVEVGLDREERAAAREELEPSWRPQFRRVVRNMVMK